MFYVDFKINSTRVIHTYTNCIELAQKSSIVKLYSMFLHHRKSVLKFECVTDFEINSK